MLPVWMTKLFDELRYVSEKEQSHEITPTGRESTLAGGIMNPTLLEPLAILPQLTSNPR